MKAIYFLCLLLLSLFASGCAGIQSKSVKSNDPSPFSAQGWGGAVCTDLNHDIIPENVGFQHAVQNIRLYQSWASGFVSGVNYADNDVYDVSGATTPEEIFIWLKDYCAEHVDVAIPVALHELLKVWESEGKTLIKPE
jgi:hypothetical protein